LKSGKVETYLGFLILFVLTGIAAGVLVRQSQYDEKFFAAALTKNVSSSETHDAAGLIPDLQDYLPDGMVVLTPGETFGPDSLSEKIDGKAELYLSAGFLGLRSQRFAEVGKPDQWLELFVYDMGNMRNAFSVFSTQRRADAQDVDLARFAYRTDNALFFLQGQFYVEVIAATDRMAEAMHAMGERFIRKNPGGSEEMAEFALFPEDSLVPGSVSLLAENVFGFNGLSNTFVAHYAFPETELTAFLTRQQSTQDAKEVASAYHQFLLENGGVDAGLDAAIPEAWLVKVFDTFELVFVHGNIMAGVHEAENKDLAEQLALKLKNALAGAGR
jgi:hypothetical protein